MTLRQSLFFLAMIILPFCARKAVAAENGISLRLITCEVSEELPKVYLESNGSKSVVSELPASAFSAPIPVSADEVKLMAPKNEIPLCSIKLPKKGKSFAVFLAPGKETRFTPFVVRLDDDAFKPGDFHFLNTSSKTLLMKLGGTELVIESGESAKSRPTEPVNGRYYPVIMSVRDDTGDKAIASTRWPLENDRRSYIIFLEGKDGKISYRAINE
jgi:hypothetical protein